MIKEKTILVRKSAFPPLSSITLCNPIAVACERPMWEHGLELGNHVREYQRRANEAAPARWRFVVHSLLVVLEQFHALLALCYEALQEHLKVLVRRQHVHAVLVDTVDGLEVLVRVRQYVQYVRRRVLEVHTWLLAQFHHLVHQFPRPLDRSTVNGELLRRGRVVNNRAKFAHEAFAEVGHTNPKSRGSKFPIFPLPL